MCVQSPATLCDPMDCSPPASTVYGIFQAILERVAISYSTGSSPPGVPTRVSCTGRRVRDWQKGGGGKERGGDCIFSRCLNIPVISASYSIINTSVPIPRIDANVSKSKDQVDVPDKTRLLNWSFAVTLTHSAASKFPAWEARESAARLPIPIPPATSPQLFYQPTRKTDTVLLALTERTSLMQTTAPGSQ